MFCACTFEPDHQGHLELQLPAGLGDAVGDDGAVDNPTKDVDEDRLNLLREKKKRKSETVKTGLEKKNNSVRTLKSICAGDEKCKHFTRTFGTIARGFVQSM